MLYVVAKPSSHKKNTKIAEISFSAIKRTNSLPITSSLQRAIRCRHIRHLYNRIFLFLGMILLKFDFSWAHRPHLKKRRNEPSFVFAAQQHGLAPFLMAAIYLNRPSNRRFITPPKGFAYASFPHFFCSLVFYACVYHKR